MTRLFTALCPNLTKYVMLLQYTLHIATTINVTHATRADFNLHVSCDNLHSKLDPLVARCCVSNDLNFNLIQLRTCCIWRQVMFWRQIVLSQTIA